MRTKYLALALLMVTLSCTEDEEVPCRVTQYTEYLGNGVRENTYSYETSGKLHGRVRTFENGDINNDTYTYNTDGNVARIDQEVYLAHFDSTYHHHLQYEYSGGKLAMVTEYSEDDVVLSRESYVWTGDNLELQYTTPAKPNPDQIVIYEYVNENVVKRTNRYYNGEEPNVMGVWYETIYEEFDTALTPFYVTCAARPGMVLQGISKNNHRRESTTSHRSFEGVWTAETSVTEFSYTYNSSGATVGIRRTIGGTSRDTVIAYDGCE